MGKPRRMTVEDWDTCRYPGSMLPHLRTRSARKLRLFLCASFRHIWYLLTHPDATAAVESAELWADGVATSKQLTAIRDRLAQMEASRTSPDFRGISYYAARGAKQVVLLRKEWVVNTAWCATMAAPSQLAEQLYQCSIIRDIFGNPFRPVSFDGSSLTSTVVTLGQGIYTDRAFDRLPILADALEDAGCNSSEILQHMRAGGEHVRGCWALDLVLGKE